jgi:lysophospholipase L1-like esterase
MRTLIPFCLICICSSNCIFPSVERPQNNYYDFGKTRVLKTLREFHVKSVDEIRLVLNASEGDQTDRDFFDRGDTLGFNIDHLYRCKFKNSDTFYYFRIYWQSFDTETTLFVHWEPDVPTCDDQKATIDIVEAPFIQKGTKRVCTIGDSQTWLFYGQFYRSYWSNLNYNLNFVGSRTDSNGFGHEGEGGNSTQQVIDRLHRIPEADLYILLIGTNDRLQDISPTQSVQNIKHIVNFIKGKHQESKVNILTILPCTDTKRDIENTEINIGIKKALATDTVGVRVLDTESFFRAKQDWPSLFSDGLHLSERGYQLLASFLNEEAMAH